jgi:hypothetical protein
MAIAPLHQYVGTFGNERWQINPLYANDENGKPRDPYAAYSQAQQASSGTYGASAGSGDTAQDKMFGYLDKAADKAFGYQERTMARTNEYRTKEGATQGQMDDRAFQRLNAELETRKYTQAKGAELTNWQRDQDQKRAITSFKSIGN